MKIAMIGLSGVGKSSISEELIRILDYGEKNLFSIGDQFRVLAEERGYGHNLAAFREIASEEGSDVDDTIDGRARDFFEAYPNCIVEGRLAGYHAPSDALIIILTCNTRVRIGRVQKRDKDKPGYETFEKAWRTTVQRENDDRKRYRAKYGEWGLNFDEPMYYEGCKIVDTTHLNASEIAHQIAGFVRAEEKKRPAAIA